MKRIINNSVGMLLVTKRSWGTLWLLCFILILTSTSYGNKIVCWGEVYSGHAPWTESDYIAVAGSVALRADGSLVGWSAPVGNDFVAVTDGLALRADGSLVAWGENLYGQRTALPGSNYTAIATSAWVSLALRKDGSLVAWGCNCDGESDAPAGNDYIAIGVGDHHGVALRANGSIVCWGRNSYGSIWGQATPPPGNDFVAIEAGYGHNLALRRDGSIVTWGDNRDGLANVPAGNDFVAVAAGGGVAGGHSLALRSDGSIVGWGFNYAGQATPPQGNDFVAIWAEDHHSRALQRVGATSSNPAHNSEDVAQSIVLTWTGNPEAQSEHVYVGMDRDAIINATTSSSEFQGNVKEPSFGPITLKPGTTYFWRIDTILPSITYKGDIWQFTTLPACYHTLKGDLNQDCIVNILDLAILSEEWMRSEPALIARFTLETNPNWVMEGQWQYGVPTGAGGTEFGNPDPTTGYTGTSVYGVNINGDYDLQIGSTYTLTAGPVDCTEFPSISLRFARWLNTDAPEYVLCKVEASNDNTTWETVWANPSAIEDNAWTLEEYDISSVGASQEAVYLRWTCQVLSARALPYSGWNIDDVELLGKRVP